VFGPLAGGLFLVGLAGAAVRARSSRRAAVLVLWLAVMALPTLLAEDAPHFLRAVGLLPAAMVLAGAGAGLLRAAWARYLPRAGVLWWALAAAAVAAELGATLAYGRQVRGPRAEAVGHQFEAGATELAREVNMALGSGWRGGWAVGPEEPGQAVWLDRRLRDGWAAVPYLVPEERVTLVDPYDPLFRTGPGVAFLQPEVLEPARLWAEVAPGLTLSFSQGTMVQGDLEPEPKRLFVRVDAVPGASGEPLARFADGLALLSAEVDATEPARLVVTTTWRADSPVAVEPTAFVQVLKGDRLVATVDRTLGSGLIPTTYWRPQVAIVERREVVVPGGYDPARQRVVAGLYVIQEAGIAPVAVVDGPADRASGAIRIDP
jgi:hypothetical protein